ncbi:hypothetical protein DhcFL2_00930 [Dehalococcoides mccartyi]|nr:hypothetical protein dcmb_186 [Dehalococcoides mccartyi DCMB5]QBX63368.1 hypothetical protein DhcFL2_00930 [Dehalococcoides mccartyi]
MKATQPWDFSLPGLGLCETGAKPELQYFLICVALLVQSIKNITSRFLCQIYPQDYPRQVLISSAKCQEGQEFIITTCPSLLVAK